MAEALVDGIGSGYFAQVNNANQLHTFVDNSVGSAVPINIYNSFTNGSVIGPAAIDDSTFSFQTIPYEHHEIHNGTHYFVKTFVENTGGADTSNFFGFTSPNGSVWMHAKALLAPDTDVQIEIFEGADFSGGTPITAQKNNRNATREALSVQVAEPTVITSGTPFWVARNGGGRNPVGVAPGFNYEIVALSGTNYLFKLTKKTAADTIVDIDFFWYEHADKITRF